MKSRINYTTTIVMCMGIFLFTLQGSAIGMETNDSQNNGAESGRRYEQTGGQGNGSSEGGRPRTPPQKAIDACSGKSSGDKVEFTTPRGETVSGICVKHNDLVFAVPEGGKKPQRGGMRQQRKN